MIKLIDIKAVQVTPKEEAGLSHKAFETGNRETHDLRNGFYCRSNFSKICVLLL